MGVDTDLTTPKEFIKTFMKEKPEKPTRHYFVKPKKKKTYKKKS